MCGVRLSIRKAISQRLLVLRLAANFFFWSVVSGTNPCDWRMNVAPRLLLTNVLIHQLSISSISIVLFMVGLFACWADLVTVVVVAWIGGCLPRVSEFACREW